MILVYTHKLTPRVKYIFKTIFVDILQVKIDFTNDLDLFKKSDGVKINYSNENLNCGIYFEASTLLFENTIQQQKIDIGNYDNKCCFYHVTKDSALPFDPFAASFYLISRYEEYLPHKKDRYGRFCIKGSLAYMNSFLDEPLVNIWINKIVALIENEYPAYQFPKRGFKFLTTIDIDNAYAYKNKSFSRTIGGLSQSLLKGEYFIDRIKVIFGRQKDPYDTYDYQKYIHKKYDVSPLYFFLIGDYGKHDKNISYKNKNFQTLIKSIATKNKVGIHPSYQSNFNNDSLKKEKGRLKKLTKTKITRSRQHYLMLTFPNTYQSLIKNCIKEDYTMGFAQRPGFRASICSPFYFYDLSKEEEMDLKIYPFAAMEATFKYYQKTTPEKTLKEILSLMQKVQALDGLFISVWHNESLSNKGIWKGWRIVYEKMLKQSKKQD